MKFEQRAIDHLNVMVPNLEQSIEFYTNIMNFTLTERYKKGDMEFVYVTDGTITYELREDASLTKSEFNHIAYVSQDIKADYEFFQKTDSKVIEGEIGFNDFLFDNGVYFFFINGAGGERIEFCQRA